LLENTLTIQHPSEAERAGLIQFFEISFELSWKVLKDYLEEEGFTISSPRDAIKQAFQAGFIENGHVWIEALKDRNLTVHTYEEKIAIAVDKKIRASYFPALQCFALTFKAKFDE
jgi:nucleotidyltransferase substrate binding protein (TIGR01987 family)